jgi:hypothetical protein
MTHLALKNNHSIIQLLIMVYAVLIIHDYSKYVIDQCYLYFIATCSCFKVLRFRAFLCHLRRCFLVGHFMLASLYPLIQISAIDLSFPPWQGVFSTNLFDQLDKVWECLAYVLITFVWTVVSNR